MDFFTYINEDIPMITFAPINKIKNPLGKVEDILLNGLLFD
jgi:hypothetical protein